MAGPEPVTVTPANRERRSGAGSGGVAPHLVQQGIHRLEVVAWCTFAGVLGGWLGVNLFQGSLAGEFSNPREWAFPIAVLAASLGMIALARSHRSKPTLVLRWGLVYLVVVSFGIAGATHFGAFEGVAPRDIEFDRVGLTLVGPWMLFFSALVPFPPREALVALSVAAAAAPITYLIQVPLGLAPALPMTTFVPVLVMPYVLTAVLAYIAARIVHRLGVELRQANELGSYRLEELLGTGGMGEVWRASHRALARPAAIKLIRPEVLDRDPEVAAARFEREAQAIASLQSPNTVALYDYGSTPEGLLYYVMELLEGVDLETLVRKEGPLPPERAIFVLRQVCASLGEAHSRGIIHRDIKPANIYLCRRGSDYDVAKVLDFGLVKHLDEAADSSPLLSHSESLVGTPAYLAPELAGGAVVDGRADLYSLGCVGFWLLTGRLVFEADSTVAVLAAHLRDPPPSPGAVSPYPIPQALDQLILDSLAKDPAQRPASAEVMAQRLADISLEREWTNDDATRWWRQHVLNGAAVGRGPCFAAHGFRLSSPGL